MKNILKSFLYFFVAIFFTGAIGILTICDLFVNGFQSALNKLGWLGAIILVLSCIIVSIICTFIKYYKAIIEFIKDYGGKADKREPKFFDALTNDLSRMMTNREYSDVIRVGSSLSRALWIAGEYENRITIGNFVYEAACKNQNDYARAIALIDDIGWTYVLLDNIARAKNNIKEGIRYAQSDSKNYWVAKGYRHLFNIELINNNNNAATREAQEYLSLAEQYASKIPNNYEKEEMLSGIEYDKIELLIVNNDYIKAKQCANNILIQYKGRHDNERIAKIYSLLGKLSFLQEDYSNATGNFLNCLAIAEKISRTDEIIKSNMGLAVCNYMEGDVEKFYLYQKECEQYLQGRKMHLIFWDVIFDKYKSIS